MTSILDVDRLHNIGPALRDAVEAGIVEGPAMKSGTFALMTAVGGTAGRLIPDQGIAGYAEVVRDKDEMVKVTRRQIKDGADLIKIHATGLIPARAGEVSVWTRDELKTVCDTAHALGIQVAAHSRNASCTRDCAIVGVDIVFHASYMDDAALEAVIEHGTMLGPVFTFLANLAAYGEKAGATRPALDVFRDEMESTGAMMRRAYDDGVPLLCGSESGFSITPSGHWQAREMEVFVEYLGLSPLEAISCCIQTNAKAVGADGDVGVLAPGMRADILVLDGDPSRDVAILGEQSRFRFLFKGSSAVDLTRRPERRVRSDEVITPWSTVPLTWELAHS